MKQTHLNVVGFNRANFHVISELGCDNPAALQCLLYICQYMDDDNTIICSAKLLQEVCKKSPSIIARAIEELKDRNLINILKRDGTNVYIVNSDFAITKPQETQSM